MQIALLTFYIKTYEINFLFINIMNVIIIIKRFIVIEYSKDVITVSFYLLMRFRWRTG